MKTETKETVRGEKKELDEFIERELGSLLERHLPELEDATTGCRDMGIDLKDTYFKTKDRKDANEAGRLLSKVITAIDVMHRLNLKSK